MTDKVKSQFELVEMLMDSVKKSANATADEWGMVARLDSDAAIKQRIKLMRDELLRIHKEIDGQEWRSCRRSNNK